MTIVGINILILVISAIVGIFITGFIIFLIYRFVKPKDTFSLDEKVVIYKAIQELKRSDSCNENDKIMIDKILYKLEN